MEIALKPVLVSSTYDYETPFAWYRVVYDGNGKVTHIKRFLRKDHVLPLWSHGTLTNLFQLSSGKFVPVVHWRCGDEEVPLTKTEAEGIIRADHSVLEQPNKD